jgi:hypothetical protein
MSMAKMKGRCHKTTHAPWTRRAGSILSSTPVQVIVVVTAAILFVAETGGLFEYLATNYRDLFGYHQEVYSIDHWRAAEAEVYRAAPFVVQLPILWALAGLLGMRTTPQLLSGVVILSAIINHVGIFASDLYETLLNLSFLLVLVVGLALWRKRRAMFGTLSVVALLGLLLSIHLFVVIGIDGMNRSMAKQDLDRLLAQERRTFDERCLEPHYRCFDDMGTQALPESGIDLPPSFSSFLVEVAKHPEWPFASAELKSDNDVYLVGVRRGQSGNRVVIDQAYTAMHAKLEVVMSIMVILQTSLLLAAAAWLDRIHTH